MPARVSNACGCLDVSCSTCFPVRKRRSIREDLALDVQVNLKDQHGGFRVGWSSFVSVLSLCLQSSINGLHTRGGAGLAQQPHREISAHDPIANDWTNRGASRQLPKWHVFVRVCVMSHELTVVASGTGSGCFGSCSPGQLASRQLWTGMPQMRT